MKRNYAQIGVWVLFAVISISRLVQLILELRKLRGEGNFLERSDVILWGINTLVFALVATLIISRQPKNLIGWLLMSPAIAMVFPSAAYLSGFTVAPENITLPLFLVIWFDNWGWLLLIFPILFISLLYPSGRALSARWRLILYFGLGLSLLFIFFTTFTKEIGPSSDGTWTIENPIGFIPNSAFPFFLWFGSLGLLTLASAYSLILKYRRKDAPPIERAQIRWLLYACALFAVFYIPGLFNAVKEKPINSIFSLLLPVMLMLIPAAIAIAVLRYHVWDIDIIIRRTLVYVPLTAIMAGIFSASTKVLQTIFTTLIGSQTEVATVLTTLIIVAVFDPVKRWLQKLIDTRFKEIPNPMEHWKAFDVQVKNFVDMNDPIALVKRLLEEVVKDFDLKGGTVYLKESAEMTQIWAIGDSSNPLKLEIPLQHHGNDIGYLSLSSRRNGQPLEANDQEMLEQVSASVAAAIMISKRTHHTFAC